MKYINITETLLNDQKVECAKGNHLIRTISLVTISFLLQVVICASCYFYYTKHQPIKKHLLPFNDTIIKLKILKIIKNILQKWRV